MGISLQRAPSINAPFQPNDLSAFPPVAGTPSISDPINGDADNWTLFIPGGPDYRQLGQWGFRSFHPGGANFLVRRRLGPLPQAESIDNSVYQALGTRSNGELIQGNDL